MFMYFSYASALINVKVDLLKVLFYPIPIDNNYIEM